MRRQRTLRQQLYLAAGDHGVSAALHGIHVIVRGIAIIVTVTVTVVTGVRRWCCTRHRHLRTLVHAACSGT